MNYRLQDVMKLIIPGLYLLGVIMGYQIWHKNTCFDVKIIKDLTSIVILFIPFVAFVSGYFIECLMTFLEHFFYFIGGRRPSKTLLSGSKFYRVAKRQVILDEFYCIDGVTNKIAGKILQEAKQRLGKEQKEWLESFRNYTALARNIFGSQLVFVVYLVYIEGFCQPSCFIYLSFIILLFFLGYWLHQNHVYIKYVFAEYVKVLENEQI